MQKHEDITRFTILSIKSTMALHTSEIMRSARHIYEKIGFKIL